MIKSKEHPIDKMMPVIMIKLYKTISGSLPMHTIVGYPLGPKPNPPDKNKLFLSWEEEFSFCFGRFAPKSAIEVIMGICGSRIPNIMQVM